MAIGRQIGERRARMRREIMAREIARTSQPPVTGAVIPREDVGADRKMVI